MPSVSIPLTKGKVALIDQQDLDRVSPFSWHASYMPDGDCFHAATSVRTSGRKATVTMHRLLMCFPLVEVDHVNRDPLDNRRCNLRLVSRAENARNRRGWSRARSPFKGVSEHKHSGRWQARIYCGRAFFLGLFATQVEAALAYDRAARDLHGDFACLNFPEAFK